MSNAPPCVRIVLPSSQPSSIGRTLSELFSRWTLEVSLRAQDSQTLHENDSPLSIAVITFTTSGSISPGSSFRAIDPGAIETPYLS